MFNSPYFLAIVAGLLGVFVHALYKIGAISKRLSNETYSSVWKQYWQKDIASFLVSVGTVVALVFILGDFLHINLSNNVDPGKSAGSSIVYYLITYVRASFFIVGWFGDSIIHGLMGNVEKFIKSKDINLDKT